MENVKFGGRETISMPTVKKQTEVVREYRHTHTHTQVHGYSTLSC